MAQDEEDIKYTVFVRIPFPRGDFVDPPTANWNAAKEAALWQTLNSTPKGAQIDWDDLAETFEASPAFLLQQAAWLYEKQLSHVREHLQVKHTKSVSNATGSGSGSNASPTLPPSTIATVAGSHAMRRGGSSGGGGGSRAPSALSLRAKTSKDFRDTSGPSTPVQARVPYSRTASSNTVTQIQRSPPAASKAPATNASSPQAQRPSAEADRNDPVVRQGSPSPAPKSRSNLSSSSSSSESIPVAGSRMYTRRPRFPHAQSRIKGKTILSSTIASESGPEARPPNEASEEEDDEDDPTFLPFSNPPITTNFSERNAQDLAATLRRYSRTATRPTTLTNQESAQGPPAPSGSSSDTFSSPPHSSSTPSISSPSGALRSPTASMHAQHTHGAVLSPRQKRLQKEAAGSDGTPSMGSSFSDLDDASVTHSAMEEALANQMRQGGKGFSGMGVGSLGVVGRMGGFWKQGSGESSGGRSGGAGPTRGSMGNRSKSER